MDERNEAMDRGGHVARPCFVPLQHITADLQNAPPTARGRPVANAYGIHRTAAVRRANEVHLL